MSLADLGDGAAAGEPGGHAPVADAGDLRDEAGADHETCAAVEVERGRARIHHRADAENDLRVGFLQFAGDRAEQVTGEIAAVGELDRGRAAPGAGADHVQTNLGVRVIEDRDHALGFKGVQDGEAVVAHDLDPSAGRSGSGTCLSHPAHGREGSVQDRAELCVSDPGVLSAPAAARRTGRRTRAPRRVDRAASGGGGSAAGGKSVKWRGTLNSTDAASVERLSRIVANTTISRRGQSQKW